MPGRAWRSLGATTIGVPRRSASPSLARIAARSVSRAERFHGPPTQVFHITPIRRMANVGFQVFDPCPRSAPMLTLTPPRCLRSGFRRNVDNSMEELAMKHMHLDVERLEQRIAPGLIGGVGVVLGGGAAAGARGGASYASHGTGSHGTHSHESHGTHSS